MNITKPGMAGSLESNDCLVAIYPVDTDGIHIDLESIVQAQYGEQIEATVRAALAELGVQAARVRIQDKGALECTIKARVEVAVCRSGENDNG